MGLTDWLERRKEKRLRAQIFRELDETRESATELPLPPDRAAIIFSDQHKGAQDGADDFQRCERTYNAALAYYDRLDHHLILLGDAEELWENSPEEVIGKYTQTLALEARFIPDGRYTRIWGNHDLAWSKAEFFRDKMKDHGAATITPAEAVRIPMPPGPGGKPRELLLVHGHQGTDESDRNARLSQFFVRHGWRRLQRLVNKPWNTPAIDWKLRGEHAAHMAEWAAERRVVLIAGHTHQPVFYDSEKKAKPTDPASALTAAEPGNEQEQQALRDALHEWEEAEARRLKRQKPISLPVPCYFNTGCCSFGDGDITGIELSGGEIRLVHWACESPPHPEEFTQLPLSKVFELVETAP